jgi:hypothetical protein
MTPEERFNKIESLLHATAQQHAGQQEQTDKHNNGIQSLIVVARTVLDSIKEMRERHERGHDRVLADIEKLREAQAATGEKLNILSEHEAAFDEAYTRSEEAHAQSQAEMRELRRSLQALIETVDRIIRREDGRAE